MMIYSTPKFTRNAWSMYIITRRRLPEPNVQHLLPVFILFAGQETHRYRYLDILKNEEPVLVVVLLLPLVPEQGHHDLLIT